MSNREVGCWHQYELPENAVDFVAMLQSKLQELNEDERRKARIALTVASYEEGNDFVELTLSC